MKIENIKKKYSMNKVKVNISIIIFLTLCCSIFFYKLKFDDIIAGTYTSQVEEIGKERTALFTLENDDEVLKQTYLFKESVEFTAFSLYFENDEAKNGFLNIVVRIDGAMIFEDDISVSNLKNGNNILDMHKVIKVEKGTNLEISITPLGLNESETIGLFCVDDIYDDGKFMVNGYDMSKDLSFIIYQAKDLDLTWLYFLITISSSAGLSGIYYMLFIKKIKIENVYLICASVVGCAMLFILPPGVSPDEETTFNYSLEYSSMIMNKTEANSVSIREEENVFRFNQSLGKDNYSILFNDIFAGAKSTQWIEKQSLTSPSDFVSYIPTTIGVTLARFLNLGIIASICLSRLCNMIFSLGITYLAIKKLPVGKILLFLISMLPIVMQEMISITRDGPLNAVAFLSISYALYLIYEKTKIEKREIIIISLINAVLILCKSGTYIGLAFLPFLIPREKVGGMKKQVKMIIYLTCAMAITMLIYKFNLVIAILTSSESMVPNGYFADHAEPYSIAFFINNPKDLLYIIYQTIASNFNYYKESLIGVNYMGWLNIDLLDIFEYVLSAILIISAFKIEGDSIHIKMRQKVGFMCISSITIILIFLGFLLTWTPMGSETVWGLQGRYFLPILFLIYILFRNDTLTYKKNIDNILIMIMFVVQIGVLYNLLLIGLSS